MPTLPPTNSTPVGWQHAAASSANLIFAATPQVETRYATMGFTLIGTTRRFAQDVNELKLPGFTLVNSFLVVRPIERVQLMLNVNNVFDTLALDDMVQGAIPANGIVLARSYNGRTVSLTVRYSFSSEPVSRAHVRFG